MAEPVSFPYLMICLLAGIASIVVLTVRFRLHAFFALILACFVVGIGLQMPLVGIIDLIKEGFGNIMKSLSLIIILGTTLGVLLEHSGSTSVMAEFILKKVGERQTSLSLGLTGFIAGLPLFCDSGYIVLSGLNRPLSKRTGISIATLAGSLSTGLYAVHCLIPPHPGATAAAGIMGVDLGKLIVVGIVVAIPAMLTGYWWSGYAGKRYTNTPSMADAGDLLIKEPTNRPGTITSFLPVVIPIFLITLKSFMPIPEESWLKEILIIGDPVIALTIGVLLAFTNINGFKKRGITGLVEEAISKAGVILVIIGAGGAFGAVLAAAHIGESFQSALSLESLGILFPFLLTFILKTAQGSSTVAIITTGSIVLPLLPSLGLNEPDGKMLAVLSMGAGSMMISHANDSYFWVIAKFSGLEMNTMLKVYSVATLFMGITSFLVIYVLSLFIL